MNALGPAPKEVRKRGQHPGSVHQCLPKEVVFVAVTGKHQHRPGRHNTTEDVQRSEKMDKTERFLLDEPEEGSEDSPLDLSQFSQMATEDLKNEEEL